MTSFMKSVQLCCIKPEKWEVIYRCARGIHFASFYDFSVEFRNCSDSVVCYFISLILFIMSEFDWMLFLSPFETWKRSFNFNFYFKNLQWWFSEVVHISCGWWGFRLLLFNYARERYKTTDCINMILLQAWSKKK
jgi:hypothetical protein